MLSVTQPGSGEGSATRSSAGHVAAGASAKLVPGAVLIFAGRRPAQRLLPVGSGALELGRIELSGGDELDAELSRRHVRLSFAGGECRVRDLDSRNGTYLNGVRISGEVSANSCTFDMRRPRSMPLTILPHWSEPPSCSRQPARTASSRKS